MRTWPKSNLPTDAIITLTTDFGMSDWYVGAIKGVVLKICPRAVVVDLTHELAAGDIRGGALALAASYRYFTKGAIHLAVVDPGVGSKRRGLAVQTSDYTFVGPDNGVLSWALAKEEIKEVRLLENNKYFLKPVSQTFHGRDIFAPVAAHLLAGISIRNLGSPLKDFVRLKWPEPRQRKNEIAGEVIYIDRFGNAITNIAGGYLDWPAGICEVRAKRRTRCPVRPFYQAVPVGRPVALLGSSGLVEISINGGSAEKELGLKIGTACNLLRQSQKKAAK